MIRRQSLCAAPLLILLVLQVGCSVAPRTAALARRSVQANASDLYSPSYYAQLGFRKAANTAEASQAVAFAALLPTDTADQAPLGIYYRNLNDPADKRGELLAFYSGKSGKIRIEVAPASPGVTSVTAAWAQDASATLGKIGGVPVFWRDASKRVLADDREVSQPSVVVWVWDGLEWAVYSDRLPAVALRRVARSVLAQRPNVGAGPKG